MARATRERGTGSARATVDHDEIRAWVERNGGWPTEVARASGQGDAESLRIDFTGRRGEENLARLSWDEFFQRFDRSNLAFLYQDATKTGRPSRFNKLVRRETVTSRAGGAAAGGRVTSRTRRGAKAEPRGGSSKRPRAVKQQSFEQPIRILKEQHREALELLGKLQGRGANRRSRERVFDELVTALAIHFDVEEQVFYPSLKKRQTEEMLRESAEEHLGCKRILADLIDLAPDDSSFEPKIEVLRKLVEMHIEHEENELFPMAERILKGEHPMAVAQEMTRVMEEIRSGGVARDRVVENTGEAAHI